MAKQSGQKPYQPQIPPERQVQEMMKSYIQAQLGQKRITRGPGSKYIVTCVCDPKLYKLTDEWGEVVQFEEEHADCV